MKRTVTVMLLFSAAVFGQTAGQAPRDVAPLKYWPAPLYWQPGQSQTPIRPEAAAVAQAGALPAQTPANSLVFVGMTPCRIADTRSGFGFSGAFGPPSLAGGATRAFPIQASTTCTIPSIAKAYSFNLTVVTSSFLNYITVWPYGSTQPNASTLNDDLGTVVANAAIIPAGNDGSGSINVYASNNTDFIIDINGYYAAQTGITLTQGTLSAPSLSFSGDSQTGIYSSGAGIVNVAAGGTLAMSVGGVNTSIGGDALAVNTSGTQNTADGYFALFSNTTGSDNTAVGYFALGSNTTAVDNTAIGALALHANAGPYNTAVGHQALYSNTTGDTNIGVGYQALYGNTVGSYNIALGYAALFQNTTGNSNIAIGVDAGYATTGSNNIDIGNEGVGGEVGVIRIGNSGNQGAAFIAGIDGVSINSPVPVYINANGQLGTASSSRRYKDDIRDMGDASSALLQLRPVTFRYKQPYADGSKPIDYGLIAEEVAEIYPDLVVKNADGQIETVQYQKLTPMLLNELQKQHEHAQRQDETIRQLQDELAALKAFLAADSGPAQSGR